MLIAAACYALVPRIACATAAFCSADMVDQTSLDTRLRDHRCCLCWYAVVDNADVADLYSFDALWSLCCGPCYCHVDCRVEAIRNLCLFDAPMKVPFLHWFRVFYPFGNGKLFDSSFEVFEHGVRNEILFPFW